MEEKNEIQKAIKKFRPESILILGTSDGMVHKIAHNLELPQITEIIYIKDISLFLSVQVPLLRGV